MSRPEKSLQKKEELPEQLFFNHLYRYVTGCHTWITTRENENILIVNKLSTTLLEICTKKSIAIDRQIFPYFRI